MTQPLIREVRPLSGFDFKPSPFIGTWVGRRYVGGATAQGNTTLLSWEHVDKDPVIINESPGVLFLACGDPSGARVALARVHPQEPDRVTNHDPASVVCIEFDPLDGVILLGTSVGARFDYLRPGLVWAPDGKTLAVGGLTHASHERIVTAILRTGPEAGQPIRWLDASYPLVWTSAGLTLLTRGQKHEFVRWSGVGTALEPRALPEWRSPAGFPVTCKSGECPVWIGPKRLLDVETLQVTDLETSVERPLLAPELKHLVVRDFSPDGTLATLEDERTLFWAFVG